MSTALAPGSSVLVVGAGVVGTSTAYALSVRGFEVTLVTAEAVGDGASAGNAGLLVPADSVVWAGPANARAVPAMLIGRGGSSIRVEWGNLHTVAWGLRFLSRSTASRYDRSCRSAVALSRHSLQVAESWVAESDLGSDLKRTGMLFLADSRERVAQIKHTRQPLADEGETYVELTRAELAKMDPAYARLPQGIRPVFAAGAARGDSQTFSRRLAQRIHQLGGSVREHSPADEVVIRNGRATGVRTGSEEISADAVVLAAGTGTPALARVAGVRAPILPVKGYAATLPVTDPARTPDIGGVLESKHVAFSRMGSHLRLSTGAEIGGRDHKVTASARQLLRRAGEELFPGALNWEAATFRAEHRPMTPGGLPLIGASAVPGLYLNAGHGSLGWTQAAGSADLLAHLVQGERTPIDATPFQPYTPRRSTGTHLRLTNRGDITT